MKKSDVRIFEILIILASAGRQSSVNLLKTSKKCRFSCFGPQKRGKKLKLANFLHHFFLNHTKMTLTNFQWISTKIEDLHTLFVEISNCDFLQKWTILAQNCENFHENI